MPVKVKIPTPLRKLTSNQSEVEVSGDTIDTVLRDMEASYPGIKDRICDESGDVRRFINIYVNEEDEFIIQGKLVAVIREY